MLTEEGYKKLQEKLDYLKSVRRIEVSERLKAAIALGDLSENSEYDDAKNEQAFLEGEILDLEAKIRNSDIIQGGASSDTVQMGSTVVVKDVEIRRSLRSRMSRPWAQRSSARRSATVSTFMRQPESFSTRL